MNPRLDRVILGSNPLVGIDHFDSARARRRVLEMNLDSRLRVASAAFSSGAGGFSFELNQRTAPMLEEWKRTNPGFNVGLYPLIPSDFSSVRTAINTKGTVAAVTQLLDGLPLGSKAKAAVKGGFSFARGDLRKLAETYIEIEIGRIRSLAPTNFQVKSVLIHESITDLGLVFGAKELARTYVRYVSSSIGILPGFVTRNFPRFLQFCIDAKVDLDDVVIMTPFNESGFQMAPSREACEAALKEIGPKNVIAISILAGGRIDFDAALDYLRGLSAPLSVCVGVSTVEHAQQTFPSLSRLLKN
jgi:hypothetical protein